MTDAHEFRSAALPAETGCGSPVAADGNLFRDNNEAEAVSLADAGHRRSTASRRNGRSRSRFGSGLLGRFLRTRGGATMMEFALVSPLFLLLTFAIVDNGLVLFTQSVLDNATREAARQISIGKVQTSGDTDGTGLFTTTLCNNLGGFIPCPSAKLKYHVQSSNVGFSSITATITTNSSTGVMTSTGFSPGTAQYYVLVQVAYAQPYIMALLDRITGANANITLVSTVAFQTEHYQ